MSYHLNGVMLDTMAHEFAIRFPNLPDSVKLDFDGTLLCQLAEDGNHVVKVALNLVCGFVDDATTIAQTHGGGGGSPGSGWGNGQTKTIGSGQEDAWQWHAKCALRPSEEERRCNTMLICYASNQSSKTTT